MKKNVLALLLGIMLAVVSCGPTNTISVTLTDLLEKPEAYVGENITVEGHVIESLGEHSRYMLLPYYTTTLCNSDTDPELEVCSTFKYSLSQVRTALFRFGEGDHAIIVSEETGGLYLPIPIVLAGSPDLPDGELKLTGVWTKDSEGEYTLYISGTEELELTSTPEP